MKHSTKCKFCGLPLTIEIDDDYAKLGDPYKIIPFAACNRCADLRERRRNLEDAIRFESGRVVPGVGQKTLAETRENLVRLTKRYCLLIRDWVRSPQAIPWEEAVVEQIIANPDRYGTVLGMIWRTANPPRGTNA